MQFRYTVSGHFDGAAFLNFVAERAAWLSIRGWVRLVGEDVVFVAFGPEALVGALEMAATLGPSDALVTDVTEQEEHGSIPADFTIVG